MRGYNPFDSVSFLIQIFSSSDHGISFVVPIRISRVFLVTNFSSILSWDCPGIPSNFSKISGQYHQYDQLKSLHRNIIIIITPYGFSCKISPEATSELAASLKQDVGIYSSTSTALSPHRSGKRIQPQCQYFSPFKPMVLTCASTQANRRHMDSQLSTLPETASKLRQSTLFPPKREWRFASILKDVTLAIPTA